MLYKSSRSAYELLGAYHVYRNPMPRSWDKNRKYAALSYRIKGSSVFYYGDKTFPVSSGDVLYIPAGVDYSHENQQEEILVIHLLCHNETQNSILHFTGTKDMEQAFCQVIDSWQENDGYNRAMSALYRLFSFMEMQPQSQGSIPKVIAPGVALMQKDFRDPELTVAKLAESCFVSQVYFRRIYKQHYGISPLEAITNMRFAYAADLLRSGYYTQKQVADLSGFSDVKYFRTAFAKHFGCTPSEFIQHNHIYQSH